MVYRLEKYSEANIRVDPDKTPILLLIVQKEEEKQIMHTNKLFYNDANLTFQYIKYEAVDKSLSSESVSSSL